MSLALEEPKQGDEVKTINGLTVAIEKAVLPFVENMTLDTRATMNGQGLIMTGGPSNAC